MSRCLCQAAGPDAADEESEKSMSEVNDADGGDGDDSEEVSLNFKVSSAIEASKSSF